MTERKPPGMSFPSWVDQQFSEAAEQGAFDDLPGAGKPIPGKGKPDDPDAWLRDYVRREGVSVEEFLPTPLKLRKQAERLAETAPEFASERAVRAAVTELNQQIMRWREVPVGPPIFVPMVDEEATVARWRDGQPVPPPSAAGAGQPGADQPSAGHGTGTAGPARRRWWGRRPSRREQR
ncbi:MAG: DUF1992 domain-containing protein [Actinomycetota bacterium]